MIKILGKLYERNPIQVIEQHATRDSNSWEIGNKGGETYNCPGLLPEESFQVVTQEKDPRQSPVDLFSWGDSAVNLGMTRRIELTGQSIGEKEDAPEDSSRQLQGHPQVLRSRSPREGEETILGWGTTDEKIRGKSLEAYTGQKENDKDGNLDLHKGMKRNG